MTLATQLAHVPLIYKSQGCVLLSKQVAIAPQPAAFCSRSVPPLNEGRCVAAPWLGLVVNHRPAMTLATQLAHVPLIYNSQGCVLLSKQVAIAPQPAAFCSRSVPPLNEGRCVAAPWLQVLHHTTPHSAADAAAHGAGGLLFGARLAAPGAAASAGTLSSHDGTCNLTRRATCCV